MEADERLEEVARKCGGLIKSDGNSFQRKARVLQGMWRRERGYPVGTWRGREIGSQLAMPWAEQTMANFLDEDIRGVVRETLGQSHSGRKKPLIERGRLFGNLLSSQPLAFNLFGHLKLDRALATAALGEVSGGRIGEVVGVEFEYSPGRGEERYTGDHSAFDVYVRYRTGRGDEGFAGIEVKYHENLENKPAPHRDRYDEVADKMGCFAQEGRERLKGKPLQQIWRDHLLAGAHKEVDGLGDGFFVFLSPSGNGACNRAVAEYRRCLSNESSFMHWTLEAMVEAVKKHCSAAWIAAFEDRYLNFEKLLGG